MKLLKTCSKQQEFCALYAVAGSRPLRLGGPLAVLRIVSFSFEFSNLFRKLK